MSDEQVYLSVEEFDVTVTTDIEGVITTQQVIIEGAPSIEVLVDNEDAPIEVVLAEGLQGPIGPEGQRGTSWFKGLGAPTGISAINGDYYLNTSNNDLYRFEVDEWVVVTNLKGSDGYDGEDGSVWHNGNGTPNFALGKVGDYYLDSVSGDFYKKTSVGIWTLQGSLVVGPEILEEENTWAAPQTFNMTTNLIERIGNETSYSERRYTLQNYSLGPNSTPTVINELTFNSWTFCGMKADYVLKRGTSSVRCGTIYVSTDGLSVSISFSDTEVGACGVDFDATVENGIVKVLWSTDATPTTAVARFEYTFYKL